MSTMIRQSDQQRLLHNFDRRCKVLLTEMEREYVYIMLREYQKYGRLDALAICLRSVLDTPIKMTLLKDVRLFLEDSHLDHFDKAIQLRGTRSRMMPHRPSKSLKLKSLSSATIADASHLKESQKVIDVTRDSDHLGFSICGGSEHGLEIFVSHIISESAAERAGLRVGDCILEVNNIPFQIIASSSAKKVLMDSPRLKMLIRRQNSGSSLIKHDDFEQNGERISWYNSELVVYFRYDVIRRCIVESETSEEEFLTRRDELISNNNHTNDRRIVSLSVRQTDRSLGFNIRGGSDFNIGIYVSRVDSGGLGERKGIRIGDKLISVNGEDCRGASHLEVVRMLTSEKEISLMLKFYGCYPVSREIRESFKRSSLQAEMMDHLQPMHRIQHDVFTQFPMESPIESILPRTNKLVQNIRFLPSHLNTKTQLFTDIDVLLKKENGIYADINDNMENRSSRNTNAEARETLPRRKNVNGWETPSRNAIADTWKNSSRNSFDDLNFDGAISPDGMQSLPKFKSSMADWTNSLEIFHSHKNGQTKKQGISVMREKSLSSVDLRNVPTEGSSDNNPVQDGISWRRMKQSRSLKNLFRKTSKSDEYVTSPDHLNIQDMSTFSPLPRDESTFSHTFNKTDDRSHKTDDCSSADGTNFEDELIEALKKRDKKRFANFDGHPSAIWSDISGNGQSVVLPCSPPAKHSFEIYRPQSSSRVYKAAQDVHNLPKSILTPPNGNSLNSDDCSFIDSPRSSSKSLSESRMQEVYTNSPVLSISSDVAESSGIADSHKKAVPKKPPRNFSKPKTVQQTSDPNFKADAGLSKQNVTTLNWTLKAIPNRSPLQASILDSVPVSGSSLNEGDESSVFEAPPTLDQRVQSFDNFTLEDNNFDRSSILRKFSTFRPISPSMSPTSVRSINSIDTSRAGSYDLIAASENYQLEKPNPVYDSLKTRNAESNDSGISVSERNGTPVLAAFSWNKDTGNSRSAGIDDLYSTVNKPQASNRNLQNSFLMSDSFNDAYNRKVPAGASLHSSDYSEPMVIHLDKSFGTLGFSISGGSDVKIRPNVVVENIFPGGAADSEGTLQPGMILLSVDGKSLTGIPHKAAVAVIKQAFKDKTTAHLKVEVTINSTKLAV